MKQFITRFFAFIRLLVAALRSSADHHLQRHFRSEVHHKPWWNLLIHWKWMKIPIGAVWEVSGDTDWSLPCRAGEEVYTTFWAAHAEAFNEHTYYYVVETRRGRVPWMMIRDFYRI